MTVKMRKGCKMSLAKALLVTPLTAISAALALSASAADWYVSADGQYGTAEGADEEHRKTSLQDALNAADKDDVIWVKNEFVCDSGYMDGSFPGRISDRKIRLTIRGEDDDPENGPEIVGEEGVRCVCLGAASALIGFKLHGGSPHTSGGAQGTAHKGGGVYSVSSGVISNCVVWGCSAMTDAGALGGGGHGGSWYGCVISNCTASVHAGGLANAVAVNCLICSNTQYKISGTVSGAGGAGCSGLTASNCVICCNWASGGAKGSTGGGGAMDGTYVDCIISNNLATSNAGGVSGGTLIGCTICENVSGARGGGCFGVTKVSGCRITGNRSATFGGGVGLQNITIAVYTNCLIACNTSGDMGGGIWCNSIGSKFIDCVISNNVSSTEAGGANNVVLIGCTVMDNSAEKSGGGVSGGECTDCDITDNTSKTSGGGYYGGGCLTDCRILRNSAMTDGGGACGSSLAMTLTNCTVACNISGLKTGMFGGAVATGTAVGCVITNNDCYGQSGGGCNSVNTYNCIIADNRLLELTGSSVGRGGGGVRNGSHWNTFIARNVSYSLGSGAREAKLYNCTVVGNVASNKDISTAVDACMLVNTIVWGNVNFKGEPAGISVSAATNSCVEVKTLSDKYVDCINTDPQLDADLRPHTRACKHAGLVFGWMTDEEDVRSKDLAGNPRIAPGKEKPDMGCYETPFTGLMMIVR